MTPQEHEVWLTVYSASLAVELHAPPLMLVRSQEPPANPCAKAANEALAAYRKACGPPMCESVWLTDAGESHFCELPADHAATTPHSDGALDWVYPPHRPPRSEETP